MEWIATYDRAGHRMSLADLAAAPLLLVDAFDTLDELDAQAEAYRAATQPASTKPGVLR